MAFARPGGPVASVHADARAPARAAAGADRPRRGRLAGGTRRPPLPGRGIELVDQPVRARRAADRRRDRWAGVRAGAGHPRRLLARAGGRAGREAAGDRAARAGARAAGQGVLRRQRLRRGRGRAEDGLPLVPQPRRGPAHQVRRAGERLPRRDPGRTLGRRRAAVPAGLRAAADRVPVRALAGRLPGRAGRVRRGLRQACRRCAGGAAGSARRRGLRDDPRAAGAVRRRHAHAPSATCSWRASCATRTESS